MARGSIAVRQGYARDALSKAVAAGSMVKSGSRAILHPGGSITSWCVEGTDPDALRFVLGLWAFPARNAISVAEAKALDLSLNWLPPLAQPLEYKAVAAFEMRAQFIVT